MSDKQFINFTDMSDVHPEVYTCTLKIYTYDSFFNFRK